MRVGLGLLVPLLLLLMRRTRTPAGLFAACCLVFVGIVADRVIFVSAGQIYPGTAVSGLVSTPWAEYVPSAVEIAIVLGAFGFLGLSYTLAERYLPMGEHLGHLAGGFLVGNDPAPARAATEAAAAGRDLAVGGVADAAPSAGAAGVAPAAAVGVTPSAGVAVPPAAGAAALPASDDLPVEATPGGDATRALPEDEPVDPSAAEPEVSAKTPALPEEVP